MKALQLLLICATTLSTFTFTAPTADAAICGYNGDSAKCSGQAICGYNGNWANCSGDAICGVNTDQCTGGICGVNVNDCTGGICVFNSGYCNGGICVINEGTCNPGGVCVYNKGTCGGTFRGIVDAIAFGEPCKASLTVSLTSVGDSWSYNQFSNNDAATPTSCGSSGLTLQRTYSSSDSVLISEGDSVRIIRDSQGLEGPTHEETQLTFVQGGAYLAQTFSTAGRPIPSWQASGFLDSVSPI